MNIPDIYGHYSSKVIFYCGGGDEGHEPEPTDDGGWSDE